MSDADLALAADVLRDQLQGAIYRRDHYHASKLASAHSAIESAQAELASLRKRVAEMEEDFRYMQCLECVADSSMLQLAREMFAREKPKAAIGQTGTVDADAGPSH